MSDMNVSDDFNDAIRRAAGLPTDAERKAKEQQRQLAQKAMSDDMPRRNAAVHLFRKTVFPKIHSTFSSVKANIADASFTIQEAQVIGSTQHYLLRHSFVATRKGGMLVSAQKPVPAMNIFLTIDENVVIDISGGGIGGSTPAVEVPLFQIESGTVIPKAFLDFVSAIKASL